MSRRPGKHLWQPVPTNPDDYMILFKSADEMWRIGNYPLEKFPGGEKSRSSRSGTSDFTGTKSWEEAHEMGAKKGWPEGAAKMREMRRRINALRLTLAGEKRKRVSAPVGHMVHIPRFIAGDVKHMQRIKRKRTSDGTHVKIGVEVTALCYVTQNQIANRGIACAALVKAVEDMGLAVELTAISSADMRKGSTHSTVIQVKRAGSYMNDERIAFTLGHPSTLRRGVFSADELWEDEFMDRVGHGYGTNGTTPETTLDYLGIDVCLPMIHNDQFKWESPSDEEMAEWIHNLLSLISQKKNIRMV